MNTTQNLIVSDKSTRDNTSLPHTEVARDPDRCLPDSAALHTRADRPSRLGYLRQVLHVLAEVGQPEVSAQPEALIGPNGAPIWTVPAQDRDRSMT